METSDPNNVVLAEETHSSRMWAVIILLAFLGPALSTVLVPAAPARIGLVVMGIVGIGAFALAWSGFQYRFLPDRLEIRTLGVRLRSIPKDAILNYSIEPWSFIRGYGIRGIGRNRAYVWGNKVVHIRTKEGDVFLGHNDPERIVRDLDQFTGFVTRG
jgi:hypothetical protein